MFNFKTTWVALEKPRVSIVIGSYNYEKYVIKSLASALNQTVSAYEVIVIDDGSKDQSVNLISSEYPNVPIYQKKNGGQLSSYNEAVKLVSGDVVIFLDSDDELFPETVAEVSKKFTKDVVKVQYKMQVVNGNGEILNSELPRLLDSGDLHEQLVKKGLLYKAPPGSGNAYRVECLKKIFPLPVESGIKICADYFCIYGVSLLGKVASIDAPLLKYRVHDKGTNQNNELAFGNLINSHDYFEETMYRWRTLKLWIAKISNNKILLPEKFLNFTEQKYFYASMLMDAKNLKEKIKVVKKQFYWLINSIVYRHEFNLIMKLLLILWAMLLPILPRFLALKLAKIVCNPI